MRRTGFVVGDVRGLHGLQFLDAPGIILSREHWQKESKELAGKPWYASHRKLAVGMAVITVAVVVPFI